MFAAPSRSASRSIQCQSHNVAIIRFILLLTSFFEKANAWSVTHSSVTFKSTSSRRAQHELKDSKHVFHSSRNGISENDGDGDGDILLCDRRHILRSGGIAVAGGAVLGSGASPALALPPSATAPTTTSPYEPNLLAVPDIRCLTDLPPVTPGCVRIYLCRHGQTENNRLRKVQGARVDPSLNQYGKEMAARIGMALSYLPDDVIPKVAVHSKLTRARETAQIAARTMSDIQSTRRRRNEPPPDPAALIDAYRMNNIAVPTGSELSRTGIKFDTLESLGEVDFGTGYDGMSVEAVRAGMYATYGSWAMGTIDRRMDGEGESGREVLERAADALHSLANIAVDNGGTVLAVSHSTYLRTLLGAVMDVPLVLAASAEQRNGCINILDVNFEGITTTLGPKSGIFGGSLSIVKDFNLPLPQTNVVRTNEYRHLEGITWPTVS
mmetsp:Transcript_1316/g.2823  ORF Transcript_1316/g.2823 Transcript_1316/m.2823 type:complete len:439 (-) Transcript_1316:849-2165(-)